MQVTHNSANFHVDAYDQSGNAVHGFISEHLPLKVCSSCIHLFCIVMPTTALLYQVSISSNNVGIDDVEVTDTGHGYVVRF